MYVWHERKLGAVLLLRLRYSMDPSGEGCFLTRVKLSINGSFGYDSDSHVAMMRDGIGDFATLLKAALGAYDVESHQATAGIAPIPSRESDNRCYETSNKAAEGRQMPLVIKQVKMLCNLNVNGQSLKVQKSFFAELLCVMEKNNLDGKIDRAEVQLQLRRRSSF